MSCEQPIQHRDLYGATKVATSSIPCLTLVIMARNLWCLIMALLWCHSPHFTTVSSFFTARVGKISDLVRIDWRSSGRLPFFLRLIPECNLRLPKFDLSLESFVDLPNRGQTLANGTSFSTGCVSSRNHGQTKFSFLSWAYVLPVQTSIVATFNLTFLNIVVICSLCSFFNCRIIKAF